MLVLSRKPGEEIQVGPQIVITVIEVRGKGSAWASRPPAKFPSIARGPAPAPSRPTIPGSAEPSLPHSAEVA